MRAVRRVLLASALVAVALPGVGAAGAPGAPVAREYVTLRGSGIKSALVRFDRTVDFAAGKNFSGEFFRPHITVSGSGVYGYAILPASAGTNALSVFGLRVPSAEGVRSLIWPVGGSGEEFSFRPGTYRLVLIGSGSGSVRFRLPGLRAGTTELRPVRRVGGHAIGFAQSGAAGPLYGAYDTNTAARTTRFLSYLWYSGSIATAKRSSDCYYEGRPPQAAAPGCAGGAGAAVADANPRTDYDLWSVGNAILDPGTWTVRSEIATAGTIDRAGAVFVWLDA